MIMKKQLMSSSAWVIDSLMVDFIVTGADGFIGRLISSRLRLSQFNVYEMTRANGDICDAEAWRKLPTSGVLIHLAGKSYVPDSWTNQADFLRANVIGTQNAIDFCIRHNLKMVYVSAYLYGIPEYLPIPEEHPIKPNNPYALSKYLAEQLCSFAHNYQGLSVAILRLFNVYGPGQRSEFLIPNILQQVLMGNQVTVNDLEPKRDYVYVEDVVEALVLTAQDVSKFSILNIGSGSSMSVRDVIEVIQRTCGTDHTVSSKLEMRGNEIFDVVADVALAHKIIGWKPKISFPEGIERIVAHMNKVKSTS